MRQGNVGIASVVVFVAVIALVSLLAKYGTEVDGAMTGYAAAQRATCTDIGDAGDQPRVPGVIRFQNARDTTAHEVSDVCVSGVLLERFCSKGVAYTQRWLCNVGCTTTEDACVAATHLDIKQGTRIKY